MLNRSRRYAAHGESDRVKKSDFLKKVNSMVLRYDIVGAQNVNVCYPR